MSRATFQFRTLGNFLASGAEVDADGSGLERRGVGVTSLLVSTLVASGPGILVC
jgi:hypothetical protein